MKRVAKQGKYLKVCSQKKESLSTEFETRANLSYMKGQIKMDDRYYKNDCQPVVLNRDHFLDDTNANNEEECDQQSLVSDVNSIISRMMEQHELLV